MTKFSDIVKQPPSAVGILAGVILFAVSLTPSLIPRTAVQQAAISALAFVTGYGIGAGINALWRFLELPPVPQHRQARWTQLLLASSGVILIYFLAMSLPWQNSVRRTVSLEPVDSTHPLQILLLTVVLSAVLLLFFRLLGWIGQTIIRFVTRFLPRRYGQVIAAALAVWLIIILLNGTLVRFISNTLNATYSLADSGNYDNVTSPTSPLRTGSPDSLVAWESLGREGRRFSGTGPSPAAIADFWDGQPTLEPIRVYIGAKSAPTLEERAELALQELLRTGAFEREVLALVTSTGNGWVDANSVDALEYIFAGNTALVAFQYSFLPSVYAMVADSDAATDASVAMFNTIHEYWQTLDEGSRPDFYLYGLSLGAFGSQAAVSSVNLFNDPIDGALWAGPPFVSTFWRQLTRDRDPGTPVWRPVYQGGRTIRFTNQGEGLQENTQAWQENRFVYLQQAGDPIVFFPPTSLFRVPEWLQADQRSPKAPPEMRWYPVATFWQLVFDMVLGTSDALPDGNGHRYPSSSYIDAWVALSQPPRWDESRTDALKALFDAMGNPNRP